MSKVGIITYHAAYNYGSVLQARATQEVVRQAGYEVEMIDYRPKTQKDYYQKLYRTDFGLKVFLKDLTMLPVQGQRNVRNKRFESFIKKEFRLTPQEYSDPNALQQLSNAYDIIISGSDQIFNKHSNELESEPWSAMDPYLLTFVNEGKKISYASSPASMTAEELLRLEKKLRKFNHISARENDAATYLSEIVGYRVPNVLDPTLLLNKIQWHEFSKKASVSLPKSYVLYYSLDGTNKMLKRIPQLHKLSERAHMPILAITPFAMLPYSKRIISGHNIGPYEFIKSIENAALVVTDSYHGTLFSINMNTPFWSISNGKSSSTRKDQILMRLCLEDRIVSSLEEASEKELLIPSKPMNTETTEMLDLLRTNSIHYLNDAIEK